jgi:hypothetical protein
MLSHGNCVAAPGQGHCDGWRHTMPGQSVESCRHILDPAEPWRRIPDYLRHSKVIVSVDADHHCTIRVHDVFAKGIQAVDALQGDLIMRSYRGFDPICSKRTPADDFYRKVLTHVEFWRKKASMVEIQYN